MATMQYNMTKEITSEINLFKLIMEQNVITNKFNREYALLAII